MRDWQIIGLTVIGGLAVGWLLAKTGDVAYQSQGTPIGPSVGTDPTLHFVTGPVTS